MKKLFLTLGFCLTLINIGIAQELLITNVTNPPKLDGIIDSDDPWDNNWIDQTKAKSTNSTNGMHSEFQLRWDKNYLYLAVQVHDTTRFIGNKTSYMNDCVEFYISLDTASELTGEYKPGCMAFRLLASPDAIIDIGEGLPEYGNFKCFDYGDHYTQEWSISLPEFSKDMQPAWDKEYFKFDIMTSDATSNGIRSQQMFWNDHSDQQWHNTKTFGIAQLSDISTSIPNELSEVSIYPVPASDFLHISGISNVENIEILNLMGLKLIDSKNKVTDISSLQTGCYFVRIHTTNETIVRSFVKK